MIARRLIAGIGVVSLASTVSAQSSAAEPGRVAVSVGVVRHSSIAFGTREANESTGAAGTFALFSTSSELVGASGVDARVGVRVARAIEAEASASYRKPQLRSRVVSDVEPSNAPIDISERVRQAAVAAGALWYPPRLRLPLRARFFIAGSAGYLRRLDTRGTPIASGQTYELGGGVRWLLKSRVKGWWKGIGARADARAVAQSRSLALDSRAHAAAAVGASLYLRF